MLELRGGGNGGCGAGSPSLPGTANWNTTLGRFWSHDYAQRIVPDPPASTTHVWLVTPHATFREFTDTNSDGTYETILPSDEYRTLVRLGANGWELRELDGSKHSFNASGLLTETRNENGNVKTATYSGGKLTRVRLPTIPQPDYGEICQNACCSLPASHPSSRGCIWDSL